MQIAALVWVLVGCWCVSRAIHWLPTRLADEENFVIAETLSLQSCEKKPVLPHVLQAPLLSFFSGVPKCSFKSFGYAGAATLVALWVYSHLGLSWDFFLWTAFGWCLLVLAAVDFQTKLLPDILTLPLMWLGMVIQLWPETRTVGLELAVIGAVAGYLPLWFFAHLYKLIRGRDGLGMGDLKLLAAMGAWSGPFILPHVLLLAALLAIALFVFERVLRRSTAGIHEERPFGPAIVAAYFIVMLFAF